MEVVTVGMVILFQQAPPTGGVTFYNPAQFAQVICANHRESFMGAIRLLTVESGVESKSTENGQTLFKGLGVFKFVITRRTGKFGK